MRAAFFRSHSWLLAEFPRARQQLTPLCFSLVNSTAISDALHSYRFCTMGAAVEGSICLYTMPNDLAAAVLTGRSKSGDGAFKTVEHVRPTSHEHLKGFIVLVAAHFTLCHHMIPFL